MINGQLQTLYPGKGVPELMPDVGFIIRKLPAQVGSDLLCFFLICDQADPSENDDAVYIQRPFAFFPVSGIPHAIADPVVLPECVKLMAFFCSMEVQLSVLRVVPVVQGYAICLEPASLYRSGEKPATANCPSCEKIHGKTSCIMVSWKNTQRAFRATGGFFFLWRKPHEESFCWAVPCAG